MKKIGVYLKNKELYDNPRVEKLLGELRGADYSLYEVNDPQDLATDTDILLSIGGDGTFLSASKRVADSGIPILGVNLGRIGFLSENLPEEVSKYLGQDKFCLDERVLLETKLSSNEKFYPYSLNEVTVHRIGAAMLGVDVTINGESLPTYWADGLLVATSSGSTAYSLSVGGPVCSPDAKVFIIAPIAPHNLNVRPLIIPDTTDIEISLVSRDPKVMLTMDNRNIVVDRDTKIHISRAPFTLKRIKLKCSEFIKALTNKFFWGEDFRNK